MTPPTQAAITGATVTPLYDTAYNAASVPAVQTRTPPCSIEAEQALLGALLLNPKAFEYVAEYLLPQHFSEALHGRIFEAIAKTHEKGQLVNALTLTPLFRNDPDMRGSIEGENYLQQLAANVVSISNTGEYGRIIYDFYLRRELIALGEKISNNAFSIELDTPADRQIEQAESTLFELATTGQEERSFQSFAQALTKSISMAEAAHQRDGGLSGVSSGFHDLDRLLGGLHPSDLIILAGRPSMGKTSLVTNIAFEVANAVKYDTDAAGQRQVVSGAVTAFFSLEMSSEQLATRILSDQAQVASENIRNGRMQGDEFDRLVAASHRLQELPLFIDDTPSISISAMRTRARRLKRQHNLGLIIVDYLQLMRGPVGMRTDNRVQEISEITRGLKGLAKELDVPVIALSQLSRQVESRDDKRPQLSDLRESGSIEQDADAVMFVYREQYYLERQEPTKESDGAKYQEWVERYQEAENKAEVIIAKQRHGPIGKITMRFDGNTTRFSDYIAPEHMPERRS